MGYTDLTTEFAYRDVWYWQRHDALAENDAANLSGFALSRRPVLKYISATVLDVEANTGLSNQTRIIFPDNQIRMVSENTSATNAYRRFDITATANFVTGTEDSGLRSGLSEANSWYAIYAVKSQINSANFVLAGDTTLPLQANFATLDSRYGSNGWVYLGLILNGLPAAWATGTGDIFPFIQVGNLTMFTVGDANSTTLIGTQMASASLNATPITYTVTAGVTPRTRIPDNVSHAIYSVLVTAGSTNDATTITIKDSAASYILRKLKFDRTNGDQQFAGLIRTIAASGLQVSTNYGSGTANVGVISLAAFQDAALSLAGMNSLI